MDKSAIKNFAIEARKVLMKSAETEAGFYGVTKEGCKSPIQKGNDFEVYETIAGTENRIYDADIKRRANLVKAVETLGFEQVIEETAYTWFNRIIAIRFMEVNDYLPTRVRVLSSEIGSNTPDIITQSLDVDLNMTLEELEKVQKAKDENRYDDAFRLLFIKQCNELNAILPGLFEKTDDYMELLLKLSYTSDGVVRMLIDSIDENNFNVETEGQVEIIGWMYQYYNTELKDDTFAKLKKNVKITKERIPAATQLFTPDWIVRYMVENSVGRVWIEHLRAVDPSVDEKEKAEEFGWKYYLPEAEQEKEVEQKLLEIRNGYAKLTPKDINCIDPCMGSGHILVYMFDVLIDIYRSEGFSERDAVFSILENNIRGLDIDRRAYQLSYFALMMKARSYNRTFFRGKQDEDGNRHTVEPIVFVIDESNDINKEQLKYLGADLSKAGKNNAINQMNGLLDSLVNAKEYGSILDIENYDWSLLKRFVATENTKGQVNIETLGIENTQRKLNKLINQGKVMAEKYWIVSTNPPYMGNMPVKMTEYVQNNYPITKYDLYSVFIERCMDICKVKGYVSMITQHTWMFIGSFDLLRNKLYHYTFNSLLHLGTRAFDAIGGEVVQTVAFTIEKYKIEKYAFNAIRLVNYSDAHTKEKEFFNIDNLNTSVQENFLLLPRNPIVYWLPNQYFEAFDGNKKIDNYVEKKAGVVTGNDEYFIRAWYEVNYTDISFKEKYPYNKYHIMSKGGSFRRYYGNWEVLIKLSDLWIPQLTNKSVRKGDKDYYFKKAIGWSQVGNAQKSFRYINNSVCGTATPTVYLKDEKYYYYILAFLNTPIAREYLNAYNPTINLLTSDICNLPLIVDNRSFDEVTRRCKQNIAIEKEEWDNFENSWDFIMHPLLRHKEKTVKISFDIWKLYCEDKYNDLKINQTYIHNQFCHIYQMEQFFDTEIDVSDISFRKADKVREIKSLISYAVGCMFGRYSLDVGGLVYAGGIWDISKYSLYIPVSDGIIPITDVEYFNDDIVTRFIEFVRIVYGNNTLEENLTFIADVLANKGSTSREKIRNYFINDFFKDHCNTYSVTGSGKRPIYWLFDSGKQNGFKCLIYMHRYNKDTLNLIRSEYLHKTEAAVENALKNAEYIIQTSSSAVDKAKATKDKNKYVKQLNEMRIYYQALSHLALQKIEIDLDDGVKHNYQLFQGIEVIVDGGKKQKVDLLAKI